MVDGNDGVPPSPYIFDHGTDLSLAYSIELSFFSLFDTAVRYYESS
jgi:hypothetical protein